MRERCQRGWDKKREQWVYGFFVDLMPCEEFPWGLIGICTPENNQIKVKPESVGDATGFYDRDGKPIYEGDIIFWRDWHRKAPLSHLVLYLDVVPKQYIDRKATVIWKNGQWMIETEVSEEIKQNPHYSNVPEFVPLSDLTQAEDEYRIQEYPENIRVIGNTYQGQTHTPAPYAEETIRERV